MIPHSKPWIGPEEKEACLRVLDSGQLAQGEQVERLETLFCRWTGRRYAIAVSSGTAALTLALAALGLDEGDEVIMPTLSCAALLHAADAAGAKPVFADCDADDMNLSPESVRKRLSRKTRAVLAAHLFGRSCRLREISALGVPVVEDATQALGARHAGGRTGSFGIVSVFSLYATKMISAGEGGIVLTDAPHLAERLRDARDYDKKPEYRFRWNAKMTDLQAAIAAEQMKKLPEMIRRRREIAACYTEALRASGQRFALPAADEERDHVYYRYVVRPASDPARWLAELHASGIDAKRPVYKTLHSYFGIPDRVFPAAAAALEQACSIPIYPALSVPERDFVASLLRQPASAAKAEPTRAR